MPRWQKLAIAAGLIYFAATAPHDFAAVIHSIITAFQTVVKGVGLH